jgi:sugar phosphate isomerase/epimerase
MFFGVGLAIFAEPGATDSHKLKIGYCGPLKDLQAAKEVGFDYFEVRTSEVEALPDAEFEALGAEMKRLAMPALAAYWLVPPEIKITGPAVDKRRQEEYLNRALARVSQLGVHVVVFGSSAARNVPEGFSKTEALAQLVDFGKRAGPIARAHNIVIASHRHRTAAPRRIQHRQQYP